MPEADQQRFRHDATGRFTVVVDGHVAELDYRVEGGTMTLFHTGVPEAIGGRGIAGDLVRVALDHARAAGMKVVPACSYAKVWIEKHPEYQDLLA